MSTTATSFGSRPFDVVLLGATGYTGRLVAERLIRSYGVDRDLRWAIAGRNPRKLEQVRDGLAAIDPTATRLPIRIADAADPATLARVASETRVVSSTVGPYALHGRELVAACVEHGTSYCDLTGETQFVRAMIDAHHRRAQKTGARIVHSCGFDSIPSDLGVLMLQEHMRAHHGGRCVAVKFFIGRARGGVSGGTLASAINRADEAAADPRIRRLLADPYALDPEHPGPARDEDRDQSDLRWDPDLRSWTAPFVMATINTRVVRRTNSLLGYAYGQDFRYNEAMSLGPGLAGLARAALVTAAIAGIETALHLGPVRGLLKKVLPASGEGPSAERRARGFFEITLIGTGEPVFGRPPVKLLGRIVGRSDPGYGETAKMLSEAAVCLARDPLASGGGVLTPAAAMGARLIDRLRRAGMTFEVDLLR